MARARRDPSPPPAERPQVVRSRPLAPVASPPVTRLAPAEADLLEHAFGYARRRVADRATAEALTLGVLREARLGSGGQLDRAGAFRALAAGLRADPAAGTDDPDAPAVALFAEALEPDLRARFDRLDLERQRVLTLRYVDRLTPAEIAGVLGTRAAAVQSRLAAGIRALERPVPAGRGRSTAHDTRDEAVSAA